MLKQLNQYKARYKDLTERFIIAQSMQAAIEQLATEEEPTTLQLAFEKVSVSVSAPDVQLVLAAPTDSLVVVEPKLLTDVKRGDTVYFTAEVPSGLTVTRWTVNGIEVDGSAGLTQLCWTVPDEETTKYIIQCVTEVTDELPDPVANLTAVAGAYSLAAAWTNPADNFAHALVTVQLASDLSFVHSDEVTGNSWDCDDLEPETDYVLGVVVVGINGKSSSLVSKNFTTLPAPSVQPDPVTNATAAVVTGGVLAAWDNPSTPYTSIELKLLASDGAIKATRSAAVDATTTTFADVAAGTYTIAITVINNDVRSATVTTDAVTVPVAPPDPVTNAAANVDGSKITISWTSPSGDYDYVKVVLTNGTQTMQEEAAATLTSVDFTDVPTGTYTATLTVHHETATSAEVTVTDIEVA